MQNVPGDRQDTKIQLSFDVCYIIEFVRGLVELLCRSWLLGCLFLPHGIENGQLLQYGHAYQLRVCTNIIMMDAQVCVYSCVLHNGMKTETFSPQNDRITELNVNFFIDCYCIMQASSLHVYTPILSEFLIKHSILNNAH